MKNSSKLHHKQKEQQQEKIWTFKNGQIKLKSQKKHPNNTANS